MVHPVRLFHAGINIFTKSPPLGNQAPRVDVGPMARTGPEKGWLCRQKLKSFGVCFPHLKGRWPRQGSCAFDHWLLAWSPGR